MKLSAVIYENLRAEMGKKRFTIRIISEKTCISRSVLGRKLSGQAKLYLDEAFAIQRTCFPELELEYLFEKEENNSV